STSRACTRIERRPGVLKTVPVCVAWSVNAPKAPLPRSQRKRPPVFGPAANVDDEASKFTGTPVGRVGICDWGHGLLDRPGATRPARTPFCGRTLSPVRRLLGAPGSATPSTSGLLELMFRLFVNAMSRIAEF